MAQLNIYVPDATADLLREQAKKAGLPLSRYVLKLLSKEVEPAWPPDYFDQVCGFLKEEFPEPVDSPPEPLEGVDRAG